MRWRNATCTPSEQALPLGTLSQLLPVSPGTISLDPVQLHNLSTQLTASSEPLLITVDDIQHADPLSLDCLFHAARRVANTRVLLLLTEADAPTPFLRPLSRERHCHRLRVGSFDVAETGLLAGGRAAEVHRLTGGNPLLVHAVLDAASLREDLLACVHRSHPSVLQVALALAVLGTSDLVSDLSGLDPALVPRVLTTMESSGLVLDGALRHPAAAGYLLDSLPRHERGDLHLRAARLLHDRGTPASSVAPHLLSADRPLAAWAAPVLQEAASQALQDGAASLAARYLELATRTATDDAGRASARSRLASVEWHDCPVTATRHVPALLAASRSGLLDPQQELSLVRLLLWRGRIPEASAVLEHLPVTAPLLSWLYCHLPGHARAMTAHHTHASGRVPPFSSLASGSDIAGPAPIAAHHTHEPGRVPPISSLGSGSDIAGALAEPWARATIAMESVLRGSRDTTVAEELLQAARAHSVSDSPVTALATLTYAGALDSAAEWCDQLLESKHRSTTLRAMLLAVRAETSLRQGDLTNASHHASDALTTLSRQAWGTAIGFPLSAALLAATRRNDHHEAAKLAEIPAPTAMFETRAGIHYTFARAHHHLANNRNHAALSDFLVIGETLANWQMADIVQWRAGAAEAWLKQGNRAQAKNLLDTPRNGHELRLRAACEEKRNRPALLLQATNDQQDQYELARTLEDLSRAWQAVGEHRRARMTARRAAHLTQKTSTPHVLSEAERKVAALAAQGHTNREIADKLFITASTVEQHLTRVYRKLNVKYRTDLPADLAG